MITNQDTGMWLMSFFKHYSLEKGASCRNFWRRILLETWKKWPIFFQFSSILISTVICSIFSFLVHHQSTKKRAVFFDEASEHHTHHGQVGWRSVGLLLSESDAWQMPRKRGGFGEMLTKRNRGGRVYSEKGGGQKSLLEDSRWERFFFKRNLLIVSFFLGRVFGCVCFLMEPWWSGSFGGELKREMLGCLVVFFLGGGWRCLTCSFGGLFVDLPSPSNG